MKGLGEALMGLNDFPGWDGKFGATGPLTPAGALELPEYFLEPRRKERQLAFLQKLLRKAPAPDPIEWKNRYAKTYDMLHQTGDPEDVGGQTARYLAEALLKDASRDDVRNYFKPIMARAVSGMSGIEDTPRMRRFMESFAHAVAPFKAEDIRRREKATRRDAHQPISPYMP